MGNEVFANTYRAYKIGTSKIVEWLIENARSNIDTTGQRAHINDSRKQSASRKTTKVECRELLPLARAIVGKVPPTVAPSWIISLLKDVIHQREKCSSVIALQTSARSTEDDKAMEGHIWFIELLKEVLSVLSEHRNKSQNADKRDEQVTLMDMDTTDPTNSTNPTTMNRFSSLNLEEPIELLADNPFIKPTPKEVPETTQDTPRYELEMPKGSDESEFRFACYSFVYDFCGMKHYVRSLWSLWVQGEISLTAAALTTNTALHCLRYNGTIVLELNPTTELMYVVKMLDATRMLHRLDAPEIDPFKQPEFGQPESYEADLPNLCVLLQYFTSRSPKGKVPFYLKECNDMDWFRKLSTSVPSYGIMEKLDLLARTLCDLWILTGALRSDGVDFQDEISNVALAVFEQGKVELWMVLAAEIFVEMHYSLRTNMKDAFEELKLASAAAMSQLQFHDQMEKLMKRKGSFAHTRSRIDALKNLINDFIDTDAVVYCLSFQKVARVGLTPFYVYKHHPILCGLMKFEILRSFQCIGILVAREWNCIIPVAHLHNLLKKQKLLHKPWEDLETFLSFYDTKTIFGASEAPSNIQTSLSLLRLQMGVKAFDVNRTSRNSKRIQSKFGGVIGLRSRPQYNLHMNTPLLDLIQQRRDGNKRQFIRDIKHLFLTSPAGSGEDKLNIDAISVATTSGGKHIYSEIRLLHAFVQRIEEEESQMNFNFLSLNWTCVMVSRQLREKLRYKSVGRWFPDQLFSQETTLGTVVDAILHEATLGRFIGMEEAANRIAGVVEEKGSKAQKYL